MNAEIGFNFRSDRAAARRSGAAAIATNLTAYMAAVVCAFVLIAVAPAAAQSITPPQLADTPAADADIDRATSLQTIPFAEFRAMTDGKTVYFELEDGEPWGREYYIPGTQDSIFVFADGECFEGHWTYDSSYYCYHYRDQPSCWLHFWEGDTIKVESRSGMRQVVGKIVEREPLSCEPELLSALTPGHALSR